MKAKMHSANYRVYVEDTDLMGIVYHSNYLKFLERARTEMLRDHEISLTMMATYGTYFAIRDLSIRYHFPARLDDILYIETCYSHIRACAVVFKQIMKNQHNELLCEATIEVVSVNQALKPKRLPKQIVSSHSILNDTGERGE